MTTSLTTDERVAQLLDSPGGCVLLLMLDENQTPLAEIADPEVGLSAIAQAIGWISPWHGWGRDRIVGTAFAYRDQHRRRIQQLVRDLVSQPGIEWMWDGVDLENQLWLPQEPGWVAREEFLATRANPGGKWSDPYGHEPHPLLTSSNRYGETSPELEHIFAYAGDWNLAPPIERRHVTIHPDARVLNIETSRDWHDFVLRYPADGFRGYRDKDIPSRHRPDEGRPWGYAPGLLVPDWQAAAADWDGVHISPFAYLTTIQMRIEGEVGWTQPWCWEGPHTVWLDWVFARVAELPPVLDDPSHGPPRHWWVEELNFGDPEAMLRMPPNHLSPTTEEEMSQSIRVSREPFGELGDQLVEKITIADTNGFSVSVLTYGGIIQSMIVPDRNGELANVALGFDSLDDYVRHPEPYFGAIIGRYANRIAGGRFALDGVEYELPVNDGPNTLHGGIRGWDRYVWSAEVAEHPTVTQLILRRTSPGGEEGFPGTVEATVFYNLYGHGNSVDIAYTATTDAPTAVNLTNHSYFNLGGAGNGDILRHVLQMRASRYLPVDENLIPTGEIAPVAGTPFDFTEAHIIGERIDTPGNEQLARAGGYDHCWVFDTEDELGFQPAWRTRVADPVSGRVMNVQTSEPGVQFYSGNFLDGSAKGPDGRPYVRRGAFCLETQHFPDSPNQPAFPSTVLHPGETFHSTTTYDFDVLG